MMEYVRSNSYKFRQTGGNMLYGILKGLDRLTKFEKASAHCDIPCGIYDPHLSEVAALTVVRMIDLMSELAKDPKPQDLTYANNMARYIAVKEEHAELVKREVRVIWGDYIKQEQVDK